MPQTLTGEIIYRECGKWPDLPDMTLAKKIFNENKPLFKSLEQVRSSVRSYRGHTGEGHRKRVKNNENFQPLEYKFNAFDLPESHAESYDPFIISQSKILVLPDLHIPYHDNIAIAAAIEYGIKRGANTILIDGDLIDMFWQSRFEKDPRNRSTKQEFEAARQFLTVLRNTFPNARIIFKEGNHDERWEKWLYVKAPEIFDDPEFTLEARLKLGELRIEIVKDKIPIKIGKLWVLHGHELQGGVSGVNASRSVFSKTLSNVLVGHGHKTTRHTEPTMNGDLIVTNSMGCLCGLWPMYARINKWCHGFAYIEHDISSGEYLLENLIIRNGKVFL